KVIKTTADGKVTLNGVTLPTTFTVWHPNQLTPLTKKQSVTLSEQGKDVSINVQEPAPRNTFGEMFKGNND
ncbi:MAG: methylamine utilization protein, partial [Pseudomonadota bacterium]|nr:methylamine utilization protein [Pseudomonadota bacterium]